MNVATRHFPPVVRLSLIGLGLFVAAATAPWLAGCAKRAAVVAPKHDPPVLSVTFERLRDPTPDTVAYDVRWSATSVGSTISGFLWAIDPASVDHVDATWTGTTSGGHVFEFARNESHFIGVCAEDQAGSLSDRWLHTFAALPPNLAPSVTILRPEPSDASFSTVSSHVRVEWAGDDPDSPPGSFQFVYRFFSTSNPDFPAIPDFVDFGYAHADSLYTLYRPNWSGWTTVPPETTALNLSLGAPGTRYLFAITIVDYDGASDSLSAKRNLLGLDVVVTRPSDAARAIPAARRGGRLGSRKAGRYPAPAERASRRRPAPITGGAAHPYI